MYAINEENLIKIAEDYTGNPLVVEGANGALGISVATVLKHFCIRPSKLYLSTWESDPHEIWQQLGLRIEITKRSIQKSALPKGLGDEKPGTVNVLYFSGYGQPGKFQTSPDQLIRANGAQLFSYVNSPKIKSFAYASTAEIYHGITVAIDESTRFYVSPRHPRAPYCFAKLLGESIISNYVGINAERACVFRVSLAFPPLQVNNDERVLADLVSSGKRDGVVRLFGGAEVKRQYQWGPNAVLQMMGAVSCGQANLYICAGTHKLTLGDLATKISTLLSCSLQIMEGEIASSAHSNSSFVIDRIVRDSGVILSTEKLLDDYLLEYIYGTS